MYKRQVKYEVRTYTDINEIKRLIKTQPQKLSLNEMYLAAQDMKPVSYTHLDVYKRQCSGYSASAYCPCERRIITKIRDYHEKLSLIHIFKECVTAH